MKACAVLPCLRICKRRLPEAARAACASARWHRASSDGGDLRALALLAAILSASPLRADTTLNLTVKDSTGALVKTGTVLIERDGAPPQSLKLGDNQPLAKPIAGNGRFHLTIVADDPGLNAWSVRNLSAQATSQSFTAELRRPEVEPQWLKQHAAALRAHFDEVMKRSRPARGASPSR